MARAFAAELLAEGQPDPDAVRLRVQHGTHPDLTWVRPSGAHVMRVEDVDQAVVAAATRTPFEASRRVFVLERVDTMNDEVANRMLKTLEEPAHFVHLILLTDALGRVLETVVSRCQLVRFDPLPAARIAAALEADGHRRGARPRRARGWRSATPRGRACWPRRRAPSCGPTWRPSPGRRCDGEPGETWRPLLERAERRRAEAEEAVAAAAVRAAGARAEGARAPRDRARAGGGRQARRPPRAHRGARPGPDADRAGVPRPGLPGRGAPEAVLASDRAAALAERAAARDPRRLREAAERCEDVRQALELNVSEDLALSALGLRLAALAGSPG